MFYCRTCNLIAYDGDRQSHIAHSVTDIPLSISGLGTRSRTLRKFIDADSVIRLNGRTAAELLEIKEGLR